MSVWKGPSERRRCSRSRGGNDVSLPASAGPESIRGAIGALGADRIRHGIRAIEDPALITDLVDRQLVLDVCPRSNLRTMTVANLAEHPLRHLVAAGVRCSISTDDPAMFDTDLGREYELLSSMAVDPADVYEAGLRGALCDQATRQRLAEIGAAADFD